MIKHKRKILIGVTSAIVSITAALGVTVLKSNSNNYISELEKRQNDLTKALTESSSNNWNIKNLPYNNKFVDLKISVAESNETLWSIALDENGDIWTWGKNDSGQLGDNSYSSTELPKKLTIDAKFTQISQGGGFWTALDTNGNIWGCGVNNYAQIGNGYENTHANSSNKYAYTVSKPIQITSGTKFTKVASGHNSTLALDINGNIWGWGYNNTGVLMNEGMGNCNLLEPGSSGYDSQYYQNIPLKLTSGTKYIDIEINSRGDVAGAIDNNNNLYMWGYNGDGQLAADKDTYTHKYPNNDGSGLSHTVRASYVPVQVKSGTKFSKLQIGTSSAIAIDMDKNLWIWGPNVKDISEGRAVSDICYYDNVYYAKFENGYNGYYKAAGDNSKGYLGTTNTDSYSGLTHMYINQTIGEDKDYTIIGRGLAIDENGDMWRWGFDYIDESGNTVTALNPIKITEQKTQYTVTFISDGKTISTQTVNHGEGATAPEAPTKAGYTFAGWDKDFSNVTSDLTVNARWTQKQYTVTFKNGDEVLSTQTVNHGEGATAPEAPTKAGYTFAGWDKDFSNVTSDLTVNARWTQKQYTVTFKNGDEVLSTQTVNHGEGATAPEAPTKAGYTFAGWDKDFSNVTSDLTVNAKWTESDKTPYTVEQYRQNLTLDGYDFIGSDTYEGTTGQTVTAGITGIEGFFVDENNTNNQLTGVVAADGSLALKVYYDRSVYQVTLNTNGGAIPEGENVTSYTYGVGVTLPTPTKEGYIFAGWYITEDLTGDAIHTIGTEATGNKEYFAKWEEGTNTAYTVEHYKENLQGTYDKVEEDTQHLTGTTGQSVTVTPNTYEGFTIKEDNILTGTIAADGSLVIRVYYDRSVYQVTLETNGGTIAEGENVTRYTYGVGATLPTPTRDGYTFAGWYTNEELEGEAIAQITTTDIGDKEYFAKWEEGTGTAYKVEHYKQNIETNTYDKVETDDLTAKTGITVTARPKTYEGYHENTTHEERVASGVISADGSLVLKLYYDVNKYTVTFKNGDTVLSTQNIAHGASAVAPETPTKVGHTFTGWDKEFSNVTSNLEVNAIWTVSSYKVTLNTNGGIIAEGEEVISYTYGVGATLPTPTRDGYTFAGWYKTEDLTGDAITTIGTLATGDKIYYAKWNNNQYTVIFKDGDTVLSTQTVVYGQAAVAPEAPTKEGYTFAGWDKDFSKVTSNLTVNAKWNKNQEEEPKQIGYKVEHYKQNIKTNTYEKVATEELTGTRGSTVTAVAKTYEGFHENTSHKERVASGEVAEDGSLVLKLYYDINQYKVIFKDGDKVVKEETVTHGGNATPPTITKPGYILSWDKGTDNITGDTTFTAVWTKDPNYIDPNANKNDGKEEKPTFLPQTGESYIVVGMISIVMSVAILVYLKYRKLNNM